MWITVKVAALDVVRIDGCRARRGASSVRTTLEDPRFEVELRVALTEMTTVILVRCLGVTVDTFGTSRPGLHARVPAVVVGASIRCVRGVAISTALMTAP